jgi:uncharacterized membrane protein
MDWFIAAMISALALSAQGLAFKRLQKTSPINVYMSYVWLGSAFILALIFLRAADLAGIISNAPTLILAGLSSWAGIYSYNRAIKVQVNLGYVEALAAVRVAITYVISFALFDASFEFVKLVGVIGIIIGVILVAGRDEKTTDNSTLGWIFWALAAGFFFALLTIAVRLVTTSGVSVGAATSSVLAIAGILFLISCWVTRVSLQPPTSWQLILWTIVLATVGNTALFYSYQVAPNLAYPVAISNTRIIILYIIGIIASSNKLSLAGSIGVLVTFVGVMLLS